MQNPDIQQHCWAHQYSQMIKLMCLPWPMATTNKHTVGLIGFTSIRQTTEISPWIEMYCFSKEWIEI
jgi:hypothetical protein